VQRFASAIGLHQGDGDACNEEQDMMVEDRGGRGSAQVLDVKLFVCVGSFFATHGIHLKVYTLVHIDKTFENSLCMVTLTFDLTNKPMRVKFEKCCRREHFPINIVIDLFMSYMLMFSFLLQKTWKHPWHVVNHMSHLTMTFHRPPDL